MRILLLTGGESSEREVSLASGNSINAALKRLDHEVLVVDPLWSKSLKGRETLYVDDGASSESLPADNALTLKLTDVLGRGDIPDIDCVFVGLHGGSGENGTIQSVLQLANMKFTGSSMTASAVAMDKAISKRLFESVGIKTPRFELRRIEEEFVPYGIVRELAERFNLPIIVKPNDGGSTVGLTKVEEVEDLHPALVSAREESPNVLIEEYIPGREVTVSVLNGEALPVVEIIPESGLYDYEAKYTKGKSEYVVPADIFPEIAERLQKAAVDAYNVIGASGLARVDFILAQNRDFYCLELNTLPGMTDLSLAPMAAKSAGIEFDELIQKIIDAAVGGQE